MDANPGVNANNLQIDSTLCIPPVPPTTSNRPVSCPEGSFPYTVQAGDTFWKLSQAYGVSLQSIISANPGVNANNLQIGSSLCIPRSISPISNRPVSCPEGSFPYTVQAGDTFWKLSQAYGVSLQSIINANPGVNANNLQIGSTLCIPTASVQPAPMNKLEAQVSPAATVKPAPTNKLEAQVSPAATAEPAPTNKLESQVSPAATAEPAPTNKLESQVSPAATVEPAPTNKLESQVSPAATAEPVPMNKLESQVSPAATAEPVPMNKLESQVSPAATAQPISCPEGTFPYTIQAGDTLWNLSQAYGVSVQSIMDANPGVNAKNLQIGSTLCIPTAPAPKVSPIESKLSTPTKAMTLPASSAPSEFAYLVERCDSICGIARKFYVSVESILQRNPGLNPRCLQAGTYIYIPINCCGRDMFRYAVRAGDTLNGIANRFNVCPSALILANPNIDFGCLVRCQIICIPNA